MNNKEKLKLAEKLIASLYFESDKDKVVNQTVRRLVNDYRNKVNPKEAWIIYCNGMITMTIQGSEAFAELTMNDMMNDHKPTTWHKRPIGLITEHN